jgi:23S rRNA (adenine2503-C2)-methyltransferase
LTDQSLGVVTVTHLPHPPSGSQAARHHLLGFGQAELESWGRARGATGPAARTLAQALLARSAGRKRRPSADQPSRTLWSAALAELDEGLPGCDAVEDADGTVRLAVRLADGAVVEAVIVHQAAGDGPGGRARERVTVCVSSQVGCRRGCGFCETGRLGLQRDLAAWEMVAQWALACAHQRERGRAAPTNLVWMGMGEPLDNLDEVVRAIRVLRESAGFAVAERRITVSTVGVVDRLPALRAATRARLAVSLHAVEPAARAALLPIAREVPLARLREAIAAWPEPVLLQWTLIAGLNDRDADADALAAFCAGLDVRVNLIPLNPGPREALRAPGLDRCRAFQRRLAGAGLRTLLRMPHGPAIGGACGQLAGRRRAASGQSGSNHS